MVNVSSGSNFIFICGLNLNMFNIVVKLLFCCKCVFSVVLFIIGLCVVLIKIWLLCSCLRIVVLIRWWVGYLLLWVIGVCRVIIFVCLSKVFSLVNFCLLFCVCLGGLLSSIFMLMLERYFVR